MVLSQVTRFAADILELLAIMDNEAAGGWVVGLG